MCQGWCVHSPVGMCAHLHTWPCCIPLRQHGTSNAMVIIQLSMYICSIPNGCSEYAYVQYKIYACCICIYVRREEVERVCLCICPSVCVRVSKSTLIWSIGMIQCFAPDPCWVIWVCVVRMSVRTLGVDCGRVFQVAMCWAMCLQKKTPWRHQTHCTDVCHHSYHSTIHPRFFRQVSERNGTAPLTVLCTTMLCSSLLVRMGVHPQISALDVSSFAGQWHHPICWLHRTHSPHLLH